MRAKPGPRRGSGIAVKKTRLPTDRCEVDEDAVFPSPVERARLLRHVAGTRGDRCSGGGRIVPISRAATWMFSRQLLSGHRGPACWPR